MPNISSFSTKTFYYPTTILSYISKNAEIMASPKLIMRIHRFTIHPGILPTHILHHLKEFITVLLIQANVVGGNINIFLSPLFRQFFRIFNELPNIMMSAILRKGIYKSNPWSELRGLNIIKGRKGAEGHKPVPIHQHRYDCSIPHCIL